MLLLIVFVAVLCLAFANGANDNFKGVATLFGSGTTEYRGALLWATVTTLLGSVTAVFLARQLLTQFTGKGIVGADLAADAAYGAAVALAAGLTVLLATRIGMPISTTHSLIGALVGAGWAAHSAFHYDTLGRSFVLPLLVSPLLAVAATLVLYPLFRTVRRGLGVTEETCVCVGNDVVEVVPVSATTAALQRVQEWSISVGQDVTCRSRYRGCVFGLDAGTTLDRCHYLSAGIVSYARGLNDTPKIAALLLLAPSMGGLSATLLTGLAIAVGGWIAARRVAETMSRDITPMNHGQGFSANLVTGLIVIGASRLGWPVSTTHVSCGSLFGIGTVTGAGRANVIGTILLAWVTTLPVAAALGAVSFWAVRLFV